MCLWGWLCPMSVGAASSGTSENRDAYFSKHPQHLQQAFANPHITHELTPVSSLQCISRDLPDLLACRTWIELHLVLGHQMVISVTWIKQFTCSESLGASNLSNIVSKLRAYFWKASVWDFCQTPDCHNGFWGESLGQCYGSTAGLEGGLMFQRLRYGQGP